MVAHWNLKPARLPVPPYPHILQVAPSHNVMMEADLEHCGAFGDIGRCGGCKNTIGSLNFIYDCDFLYCPFCGAKLNKEAK